jgi:adenylate cyclase
MAAFNEERMAENLAPLKFGIGLHVGHLAYGNIGVPERLQFTVIGSAANEAARIQELTKDQDRPVLASSVFARHCPSPLDSVGEFELRGVSEKEEIFAPRDMPGF